jgi:hypothetical protein
MAGLSRVNPRDAAATLAPSSRQQTDRKESEAVSIFLDVINVFL